MGNTLSGGESANANHNSDTDSIGINCSEYATNNQHSTTIEIAIDSLVNIIISGALNQIRVNMSSVLNKSYNINHELIDTECQSKRDCDELLPQSSPITEKIKEILSNTATPDHTNMSILDGTTAYFSASSSNSSSPLYFFYSENDVTKVLNAEDMDFSGDTIEDNCRECDETSLAIPYNTNSSARESPSLLYPATNSLKFKKDSPSNSSGTSPASNSSCVSDWKYCNGYTVGNNDFIDNGKQYTTHLDEWEKNSLPRRDNSKSALSRISLYRQFDPLLKTAEKTKMVNTASSQQQTQNGFEWMNDTMFSPSPRTPTITNGNTDYPLFTPPTRTTITNGTTDYQSNPSVSNGHYVRSPKPDVLAFATDSGCEEDILKEQIKRSEDKLKEKESYIEQILCKLDASEKKSESLEKLITTMNNVNTDLIQSISDVIDNKVNENNHLQERCDALAREKSKTLDDINGVEKSFSDLHHRYDKLRQEFQLCKESEARSNEKYSQAMNTIARLEKCCHDLRSQFEEQTKCSSEKEKKELESELIAVRAMCKKAEMKINSLQMQLNQKSCENTELAAMVDELIIQVKK